MSTEQKSNILDLLRKAIETAMPDLRHYLRPVRKAKVIAVYPSKGGTYYADVQPLRNDESVDENEPIIPKVEIPVLWAGPKRGVVCPPTVGTYCDISFYDGDPNYPRISNFRWHAMDAPEAELNEFVIQLEPGVEIRIDKNKQIITLTPQNIVNNAGSNWTIVAGKNATIKAGKNVSIQSSEISSFSAGKQINIVAPLIHLQGRISSTPLNAENDTDVTFTGNVKITGSQVISENSTVQGNSTTQGNSIVGGDSKASTRSGGSCPHK